jgi:AraC-like DNA-binding protein
MEFRNYRSLNHRTLSIILIATVIVIGMCLVGLSMSQRWMSGETRQYTQRQNHAVLELTATTLESYLDQAMKMAQLLLLDDEVNAFIYQGKIVGGSSDIQTIIDAKNRLSTPKSINPLLLDIYLYSKASDYVIGSDNAFFSVESMYSLVRFDGLDCAQWRTEYLQYKGPNRFYPVTTVTIDNRIRQVLPYIMTFPLSNPASDAGKLILLLDYRLVEHMLENLDIGEHGWYAIKDREGRLVAGSTAVLGDFPDLAEGQQTYADKEGIIYLVSSFTSSETKLTYLSAIPYKELEARQDPLWVTFSVIITVMLSLAFLSLISFAFSSHRNWDRLIHTIDLRGKTESYESIVSIIQSVNATEQQLVKENGQIPFMTETFFRRLVNQKPVSQPMMEKTREDFSIEDRFGLLMAKLHLRQVDESTDLGDIDFSRIFAKKEASRIFKERCHVYMDLSFDIWLLVWGAERQILERDLRLFHDSFENICPYAVFMGVSSCMGSLQELGQAPIQCSASVQSLLDERASFGYRTFETLKARKGTAVFSKGEKERLLKSCLEGNVDETHRLLEALYEANYRQRDLGIKESERLIKALYSLAMEYCYRKGNMVVPARFCNFTEASEFFRIQAGTTATPLDTEQELMARIVAFIERNHADVNLNLAVMAREFGLRENYLYHFTTTRMGKTFSQFLESYRMGQAKDLLESQSGLAIKEIALKCGYANPQTFRRAFSKHYGMVPSQFLRSDSLLRQQTGRR